ncbi:MAG: hypothetical protein ACM3X9_00415 [Bacillota bacterium]
MNNQSTEQFEDFLKTSLKTADLPGLTPDAEFLAKLHHELDRIQSRTKFRQLWLNGVSKGLVAAAVGLILLVGLNILPPLFVNASLSGSNLIREKIVQTTLRQHLLWQHLITSVTKLK